MRNLSRHRTAAVITSLITLLSACSKETTDTQIVPSSASISIAASSSVAAKTMHPSWDADQNGVNDCENDGSCDHTVDYSQPRPDPVATLHQRFAANSKRGPFVFTCASEAAPTFAATFYATEPGTLILEHGQNAAELQQAPAASGSKYEGPDASFWEHQGEVRIRWGTGLTELICKTAD